MIDTPSLVRMERVVSAPRHHVYLAWRTPERMARWWSATHTGGAAVRGIDGSHRVGGVVIKVLADVPLERLVFEWGNGDGAITVVTVTFHEIEGGTRLAIQQDLAPRPERALLGRLDRLAAVLALTT